MNNGFKIDILIRIAIFYQEVSANENTDNDSKTKKRPPSLIKGPDKNKSVLEAPNEENDNVSPVRKSKRQRIEAPKVAEAKLETKVYMNRAGLLDNVCLFRNT